MVYIQCFILASVAQVIFGACPHLAGDLENWSDSTTWGAQGIPAGNSDVNIDKPVLLDSLTTSSYHCINVKSGGRLVFSPSYNPNLRVHCILIETGGEMHIGSEDCKFDGKIDITLLGEPGEMNIPSFGEKFIGVQQGGVLELHGADKLSWTKLTKSAEKFDKEQGQYFRHREEPSTQRGPGAYIYHFSQSGEKINSTFQRLDKNTQAKQDANIALLAEFLKSIPDNDVFAFATQREITAQDNTKLADALDAIVGSNQFRNFQQFAAYVLVGIKGDPSSNSEDLQRNPGEAEDQVEAMTELVIESQKTQFLVFSNNSKTESRSGLDFVVWNTDHSMPIITLADDVSSWNTGDALVIASTDYKYNQAEVVYIEECDQCEDNQVRLAWPLFYTHYGEIYKRVDMRAEVGLLTRNIHINGEISEGQTNGGHIKFLKGFKSVRVEGVELSSMGQPEVLGRYPLHYHMAEDLLDPTLYQTRSYIRRNSIYDSFRCCTIHGTHNALLERNVCYNTIGHGFFLEDGGEKGTTLYGNLALVQRKWRGEVRVPLNGETNPTGAIPTDQSKGPVSFWITNPLTTLINNAAGGGDGVGFWFVYPDTPTGPSSTKNFMQDKEARHTKITRFENCTAHSYFKSGSFIDNIEQQDLTVKDYNQYDPWRNPLDKASGRIPFYITRFTAYKNIQQNLWVRGSWAIVQDSSFSDSLIAATLVKEEKVHHHFINNVVLGDSDNTGEPANIKVDGSWVPFQSRSLPMPWSPWIPRCGFTFFQGPAIVSNTWFDDFYNNDLYEVGAICFRRCSSQLTSLLNIVDGVKFGFDDSDDEGNRVYDGDSSVQGFCSKDGDVTHGFLDRESSVIGSSFRVVRPLPFHLNSNCKIRQNWNMAYCRNYYAQLTVSYMSATKADGDQMTMMRTDTPYATLTSDSKGGIGFLVIAGGSTNYLLWFSNIDFPDSVTVFGKGVTKSNPVRVGICVPKQSSFLPRYRILGKTVASQEVTSIAEVDADTTGGKYFYDADVGVVVVKLVHPDEYSGYDVDNFKECPGNKCTEFRVTLLSGDRTDRDCSTLYKTKYGDANLGTASQDSSMIPADSMDPPGDAGAGSTYPFPELAA